MNIHENGYWLTTPEDAKEHVFDESLCESICFLITQTSYPVFCYDFGCGNGKYVERLNSHGIFTIGFDGDPAASSLKSCVTKDLTDPNFRFPPVPLVVSLEVGEHIPKHLEENFLDCLERHCDGTLILSWATPGQEGQGHWNCQTNSYVIEQLEKRGFVYQKLPTTFLRNRATQSWFKQSLMVFYK